MNQFSKALTITWGGGHFLFALDSHSGGVHHAWSGAALAASLRQKCVGGGGEFGCRWNVGRRRVGRRLGLLGRLDRLPTAASSTQTQHQMQCRFLLDVVVGKCAAVFQLLA